MAAPWVSAYVTTPTAAALHAAGMPTYGPFLLTIRALAHLLR
jgi:hypothetical protein